MNILIPFIIFMLAFPFAGCIEKPETDIFTKDPDPQYIMELPLPMRMEPVMSGRSRLIRWF